MCGECPRGPGHRKSLPNGGRWRQDDRADEQSRGKPSSTEERSMTVGITELPPEGMQLGGVALAGDAERGTKTTDGLSLLFTTAGITVQGPQPQIERLLVWSPPS